MTKLVILHFSPLELYPPIQNLLAQLENSKVNAIIHVITTHNTGVPIPTFTINSIRIKIVRYGKSGRILSTSTRYWSYLKFQISAMCYLITINPQRILYFETLSSLPVYVYKYLFRSSAEVLIHYHEYISPEEYKTVKLMCIFHRLEKKLLPLATWVSHTNGQRMKKFLNDIYPVKIKNAQIMPNYPPMSWNLTSRQPIGPIGEPLKIVYIGALGLDTMYTENFARWVINQNGRVVWDIYSSNFSKEVKEFLTTLSPWINLKPGVRYNELPKILLTYNIGVILYKGHIPNFIYNAPNKLFEYLACGLGVWFPLEMTGCNVFVQENNLYHAVAIDFKKLDSLEFQKIRERNDMRAEYSFFCEDALKPLVQHLLKD